MFMISSFFFYLGDRYGKNCRCIIDGVGIMVPLLMATMRSETVGNDIVGYVKPMFLCAKEATSYNEYVTLLLNQPSTRDLEFGFSLVGYVGTKMGNCLGGVFFWDELIMLIFVYWALCKYNRIISRKYNLPKIKIYIAMFCYLTMFYNMSLSMVRQSMACSLILFCVMSLFANHYIRSGVSFIMAVSMHSTAVVAIVLVVLYLCIDNNWKTIKQMIIPFGLLFAIFGGRMYWLIMNFLNIFFPIPGRYMTYEYMWNQGNGVNLAFIYLIICAFFSMWILRFRYNKENYYYQYLNYIIWFTVFLTPMSVAAANVSRVLYYFFYFFVLLIPMTANPGIRIKQEYRALIPFTICTVFWMGTILFNDYSGTLKYVLNMGVIK